MKLRTLLLIAALTFSAAVIGQHSKNEPQARQMSRAEVVQAKSRARLLHTQAAAESACYLVEKCAVKRQCPAGVSPKNRDRDCVTVGETCTAQSVCPRGIL